MERFKYYGPQDLSIGLYSKRIRMLFEIIDSDPDKLNDLYLIDYLELYNLLRWSDDVTQDTPKEINVTKETKKRLTSLVKKYFSRKKEEEIKYDFEEFNMCKSNKTNDLTNYIDDYLNCFDTFNWDQVIDEDTLSQLDFIMDLPLNYFIKSKYFSKKYPNLVKEKFLNNPANFELFIRQFVPGRNNYHFPSNITSDDYYSLCCSYIKYDRAHPNYLEIIDQGVNGIEKYFALTPRIRLKAHERLKELSESALMDKDTQIFKTPLCVFTSYSEFSESDITYKTFIDIDWLKVNNDLYSQLMYFKAIDYFLINQSIIGLCSFENIEISALESVFDLKTEKHYNIGGHFKNKNTLILYTISIFQEKMLTNFSISIEHLLENYFNNYIAEEFGVILLKNEFPKHTDSIRKKL